MTRTAAVRGDSDSLTEGGGAGWLLPCWLVALLHALLLASYLTSNLLALCASLLTIFLKQLV